MSGPICDRCGQTSPGGLVVVLREPGIRLPRAAWGKLCWDCMRVTEDWPLSPQTPTAWHQAVARLRTITSPER